MRPRAGSAIRTVARHRVERVGNREHARAERNLRLADPVRIPRPIPPLVVVPHDLEPLPVQQRNAAQQLLPEHRVRLEQPALRRRQRALLQEDLVRDPDLPHVVEQEAVLDALILEQRRLQSPRELDCVLLNALRVQAGAHVLRLEGARQRAHRLAIGPLDERPLPALDLEQAPQILRVQDQLLLRRAGRRPERPLVETARQPLHGVQQIERAERLAQERVSTAGLCGTLRPALRPGEEDDADVRRGRVRLQLAAEGQPVRAGHAHVEDDDVRAALGDPLPRQIGRVGFVDFDVDDLERRSEQDPQRRIVVDDEEPEPTVALAGIGDEAKLRRRARRLLPLPAEDLHTVLPGQLRRVERDVRLPLQVDGRLGVLGNRGHARRDRRQAVPAPLLPDRHPKPLGDLGGQARRPLDHECELVAPDPEDLVLGANDTQEDAAHLAEDLVADDVAVLVVDPLEAVEVEEDERGRSGCRAGVVRQPAQ
jgi:hypothetical protein